MSFADKQLTCRDCSNSFLFTGGEQEFYASKGLQNEPVRCPPCRSSRKSSRLNEPEDGYVKYGVFASFGGRTPRQMHPATCADCGMMTEVPFQPRGDRPVYCSACYSKIKGAQEAEAEAAETAAIGAKSSDGPRVDLTPEERKLAETLLGAPETADDGDASSDAETSAGVAEATATASTPDDPTRDDLTPEERELAEKLLGTPAASDDGEASADDEAPPAAAVADDDAEEATEETTDDVAAEADDEPAEPESAEADEEAAEADAPAATAADEAPTDETPDDEEAKPEPAEAAAE